MVDVKLEDCLQELGEWLSAEERQSYTEHTAAFLTRLETIIDAEAYQDLSFEEFFEVSHAFGYEMASRGVPIEVLLQMMTQMRIQMLRHVFRLITEVVQMDVVDRQMHVSVQLIEYTNQMNFGYNRCQSDQLARAYELQRNRVLDALPITVVVYDEEQRCVFVNKTCLENNNLQMEQVLGKRRTQLTANYNEHSDPENAWGRVLAGERVRQRIESYGEDGLLLNEKELVPLVAANGQVAGVVSICYPTVSEKERLYNLQKQFSFVLNSMNNGLIVLNGEGVITGFNKRAEEIYGLRAEHVIGESLKELHGRYAMQEDSAARDWLSVMERGIPMRDLDLTIHMHGRKLTLRLDGNPIKSVHGKTVGYIFMIDDLTEMLVMREAIDRNEKFALIGQFAAGIAHEIRNPLTTVYGFLQLYSSGSVQHDSFQDLTRHLLLPEIGRANGILSDFLLVSRPTAPLRIKVDTKAFVDDVVRLVESEAHLRGVELHVESAEELPPLQVDVQQMKQVFLNLCKNGFDVTPAGGGLTLRVQAEGSMVQFSVIDEGPGISSEDVSHIFEPFYTTKDHGTGLGLPISHRIVEGHGGSLKVRSQVGVGTTFVISIPFVEVG
jgi:two-component system, sporulation sensor kinase E